MDERNRRLQQVFMFQPADVRANHGGQLSKRQRTMLRMASGSMWIGMLVFIFVMLGTLAFFLVMSQQSSGSTAPGASPLEGILPVAAVTVVVIVIGFFTSRSYLPSARPKQINVAKGQAQVVADNAASNNVKVKIGATVLRLLTLDQLHAYEPGVEYRVFYLAGPRPTILSAEAVGTEAEAEAAPLEEASAEQAVVQLHQRGRLVAILVGVLALVIPFAGVAAVSLPAGQRGWVFVAMGAIAIGFVPFAVWWLSPHRSGKDQ